MPDPDQKNETGLQGRSEQDLFFSAMEFDDPDERSSWLRKACGEDDALYQRVYELLAVENTEGMGFLKPGRDRLEHVVSEMGHELRTEIPEHDTHAADGAFNEKPGDMIGRYKLLKKIGEGGGGVVYLSQQTEPVKRRVALKVIKLGMDTRQVVARFEAERQALAMMDHPNIAKVFDAGATESGRPYFVMELVRGVPITEFCDENKLNTKDRLDLFMQVCKAVQHAHQKGIIHRDLKPGNVLVTMLEDRPMPKVIDFGIAKATQLELTEKTIFTQHGHFIGTPAYMSPEQASLNGHDIDTRSDIYALGVLLYELLTGKTPFDSAQLFKTGYEEIRRIIAEDEPLKPSTRISKMEDGERTDLAKHRQSEPSRLRRLVHGDLDWIIMKALEKDRRRRYETANGFALDIRRFLDGKPVTASPPSRRYRVGKFVRRNRGPVVAVSLVLLALLAGAILIYRSYLFELEANREAYIRTATAERLSRRLGWFKRALEAIRKAGEIRVGEDLRNEALACLAGSDMEFNQPGIAIDNPVVPIVFGSNHKITAIVVDDNLIEVRSHPENKLLVELHSKFSLKDCQLGFGGEENRYLVVASSKEHELESQLAVFDWEKRDKDEMEPLVISGHAYDFLSDGTGLAIGRVDDSLDFVDWTGKVTDSVSNLPGRPTTLSVGLDRKQLALAVESKGATILFITDDATGEFIEWPGFSPVCLSWDPSGRFLALGEESGGLAVVEPVRRKPAHRFGSHLDAIQHITWSDNGRLIATASEDWDIRLWDGRHGSQLSSTKARAGNFSFTPDGSQLGPIVWEGEYFSLNITTSTVCHRAIGHPGGEIVASTWDIHEGEKGDFSMTFATAGSDDVILWNRNGKELHRFQNVTKPAGLAFSTTSFYIAGEKGVFRREREFIPDPKGEHIMQFGPSKKLGEIEGCGQLAISPDGSLLAVATQSGVSLINTETGKVRALQDETAVSNLTIDWKGRWLATVSEGKGEVQIWSLPGGKNIMTLESPGAATVAFSPMLNELEVVEGKEERLLFATGNTEAYRFWDPLDEDWSEIESMRIENHMADIPGRMVFSSRGTALAISYARDELQVIDPRKDPFKVLTKPNFDQQWPLAISRDGIMIATEDRNGRLFIWNFMAARQEFQALGIDWSMKKFEEVTIPLIHSAQEVEN